MNRPLTFACIGLVLGEATAVLMTKNGKVENTLLFLLFVLLIFILYIALKNVKKLPKLSTDLAAKGAVLKRLMPVFAAALIIGLVISSHDRQKLQSVDSLEAGAGIVCIGKVEKIENKNDYSKCYLNAEYLTAGDSGRKINNVKIIINAKNFEEIKVGNTIKIEGKNKGFERARNPGNFDAKEYYNSLGYFANIKSEKIEITDKSENLVKEAIYSFKDKIQSLIDEVCGEKAALIKAIISGDKSDISPETKTAYQLAGISHILAVSGLHVSIIGMAVYKLLKKVLSFTGSAFAAAIVMVCFSILCGNSVSVLRAVIMFVIKLLADIFGKRYDLISALSLAAILLLLGNPLFLNNTSFRMSFLAITAIAALASPLIKSFDVKNYIAKAALTSLSITIVTLPIQINLYYEMSVYSVIFNMIVIPLMSFVLASSLMSVFAAFISVYLAKLVVGAAYYILIFYDMICGLMEILPFSLVNISHIGGARVLIYYLLLLLVIIAMNIYNYCFKKSDSNKKKFVVFMAVMSAFMLLNVTINMERNLQIIFMDVGQGDGILIKTANKRNVLIDGGSSDVKELYENRLESCMKYYGVKELDYCIISHADSDHTSAVIEMLKSPYIDKVKVKTIVLSEAAINNDNYKELKDAAKFAKTDIKYITRGAKISFDGLVFESLYPIKGDYSDDENENSQVLSLSFGEFDLLLTGDLGKEGEEKLIKQGLNKGSFEVLKVGHHGSKNSSSKEFLEAVKPETAIISAGVNNRYGHPHKDSLERLENVKAQIFVTSKSGAIILKTDGKDYKIMPYLIDNNLHSN